MRAALCSLAVGASLCALSATFVPAQAQLAVVANDPKQTLADGAVKTVENAPPDSVAIVDLGASPMKVIGEVQAPTSVQGPPSSVAVAPDESFAIVTGAFKKDPSDPTKVIPDDAVTVIDLKSNPPAVAQRLQAGKGAAGVSIDPKGTLALVANRSEGTVSVFTIAGKTLTPAGKVQIGDEKSGPSATGITPDGTMALVTRDGDNKISVLSIDNGKVDNTKRDISAGLRPYGLSISPKGDIAAVANIGTGGGDADTVSVIDLRAKPPRVVETVTVGQTPEGIKMSPDGNFLAVTVMNGSNKPKSSPFFSDHGRLVVLGVQDGRLRQVAEAPVGHWCQGAAWSRDGRAVVVECMVEKNLEAFNFDGKDLKPSGTVAMSAAPAAIGTAH